MTMTEERKTRRILCNDDGWIMSEAGAPLTVRELREKMVDTYRDSPVDALLWCVGNQGVYRYETRVGEVFGEGRQEFDRQEDRRTVENIRRLTKTSKGPLTAMTDLCHEAGMDIFPSLRMNSHYEIDPSSPARDRFRAEHPDMLIGGPGEEIPEGTLEWGIKSGVNYARPEVRAHMAAMISELLGDFDVDGVELDFMRHPAFFRIEEAYASRYLMTDMLRHVRRRMEEIQKAGKRRQELAVRVPPTLADSARIGLDVARWMAEGLVDIVTVGGGFIPFEAGVEEFVEAAQGAGCLVYGCIEPLRPAVDDGIIRAIASRFWSAGVSGIHLFNYFAKPPEWKRRVLGEIADPSSLRRLDKRYQMDVTDRLVPRDQHDYAFRYAVPAVQLPVTLTETLSGHGPRLRLRIADDLESARDEGSLDRCALKLGFDHLTGEDEFEIRVNGEVLSSSSCRAYYGSWGRLEWTQFPTRLVEARHTGGTLEFDVACSPLRAGDNDIEVRLVKRTVQQPSPLILRDLEVSVTYVQA